MNRGLPLLPKGEELRKKPMKAPKWLWFIAPVFSAAVLLICIILFGEKAQVAEIPKTETASKYTFSDIAVKDAGAVVSVKIISGGDEWTLSKDGEAYLVDGSAKDVSSRAKSVLNSGSSVMSRMELEGDYSDFGLSEPDAQATYTYENGRQLTVKLGNPVSAGTGYYACASTSDSIYVVGEAYRDIITAPKEKLYSVPVISERFTASDILELTLSVIGRDDIVIRRLDGGNPYNSVAEFAAPIHYPCNATRTGELFMAVGNLQPVSAAAEESLAEWFAEITAVNDKGTTVLSLGYAGETPVMRLDGDGTVYQLDSGAFDFLEKASVAWLAEQTPALVMLNRVDTVTVSAGQEKHVLKPSADAYTVDGYEIGRDGFVSLYKQLIGFLIEKYEPAAVWNPQAEAIRIDFLLADGTDFTLAFASYDDNYYLILRDDDAHFLISRKKVDAVMDAVRATGKGME